MGAAGERGRHALLAPARSWTRSASNPVPWSRTWELGFFTVPLAPRVGPEGRVYAVDIAPEMIRLLRDRDLPAQVEIRLSGENRLPIPDGEVDLALLAFVLHELEAPDAFLQEVGASCGPVGAWLCWNG